LKARIIMDIGIFICAC